MPGMNPTLEKRDTLQVRGQTTYVSGQTFTLNFDDVRPFPASQGETYVRGIRIAIDIAITSTGAQTLPEAVAYRLIDTIQCIAPNGWPYVNLKTQAACKLQKLLWAKTGKRPSAVGGGGNIALANGANTTRIKVWIPFMFKRAKGKDDYNLPLRDLKATQMVCKWANADAGGCWGANVLATAATVVRAVEIELVARDEYRVPARPSIVDYKLPGLTEYLPFTDQLLHWLIECPIHADGLIENFLTQANRTTVLIEENGLPIVNNVDARDLSDMWNELFAVARAEEIPHLETNAGPFIPLFYPGRHDWKLTQLPDAREKIKLTLLGTSTTPELVYVATDQNDKQTVMAAIQSGNVPVADGFSDATAEQYLTAKTSSKSDMMRSGRNGFTRMPIKVHTRQVA